MSVEEKLQKLTLKEFREFLRPGDTIIHHYGWKNVIRELIRRLDEASVARTNVPPFKR